MIIRGPAIVGRRFLYPSFMPAGQHLWDLQSKKGTHQKNHKDNLLIPACEEINWDCGAEQPMLMSFQLLWTSTAPTVFYLLNTKRKEKKSARFLLGFCIGFESFQKKALFKLLTTNPSLIFDLCTKMEFISAPLIVWFEELRAGGGAFLWAEISLWAVRCASPRVPWCVWCASSRVSSGPDGSH